MIGACKNLQDHPSGINSSIPVKNECRMIDFCIVLQISQDKCWGLCTKKMLDKDNRIFPKGLLLYHSMKRPISQLDTANQV